MLLRWPRVTLAVLLLAAIALGVVGLRLRNFDTSPATIVDPGSAAFRHEIEFEQAFGADPLVLMVTTDVKSLFSGNGLGQENSLEANLATRENQQRGVQSVYGPASFATVTGYAAISVELAQLQQAQQDAQQRAIDDAKAAGKSDQDAQTDGQKAASDAGNAFIANEAQQHPELAKIGLPSASNPAWMTALFINSDTGQPKPKFASFVPDGQHMLITARLDPNTRSSNIDDIVASINKTLHDGPIPGAQVTITGVPVLGNAVARALRLALLVGMGAGALSMLVLLFVALRQRTSIIARGIPVAAGILTVALLGGLVGALGLGAGYLRSISTFSEPIWQSILATFTLALNPATLAAFPIALGLAVDYSVQFLYRYTQVEDDPDSALRTARTGAGRATRRAAICTVVGLLALMISTIPMVRQFGIAMILGAALAWSVARLLTLAALKAWPRLAAKAVTLDEESVAAPTNAEAPAAGAAAAVGGAAQAAGPAVIPAATADAGADDDVALFGLSAPEEPAIEFTPEPELPFAEKASSAPDELALPLSPGVADQSAPGPAFAPEPARTTALEGDWTAAAWDGAAVRIAEAERPVERRVAAAEARPERVSAPWQPAQTAMADPEPEQAPGAATPRAPVPEPSAMSEADEEESATKPAWEKRWAQAEDDEFDDEDDEDRPPTPGAIPATLARFARRRSTQILVPALVLAVIGWIAFPFSSYQTDPEKLVSPNLPAFRDLNSVRTATGSSGELDFILSGKDVTSPEALKWTTDLQTIVERNSNGKIRPITSLAKLLTDINGGQAVTADQEKGYLGLLPPYVTNALVHPQHHLARIAFGLSPGPVEDQRRVIDQVLHEVSAPPGYTFYAAGFTYLGIRGLDSLQGGQVLLNVVGALLVLAALLAIYRRPRWALMAWVPTLLVAGWSTAVLFALRQPLTPMTAVLGALVVAFGTEFAILWLERYREAQAAGVPAGAEAAEAASRAAGPGIILSGAALTLGFLALTVGGLPFLSQLGFDLPMLRDFGLVAALDMVLAVVASLLVLPALVVRIGLVEPVSVSKPEPKAPRGGLRGGRLRRGKQGRGKEMVPAAEADAQA